MKVLRQLENALLSAYFTWIELFWNVHLTSSAEKKTEKSVYFWFGVRVAVVVLSLCAFVSVGSFTSLDSAMVVHRCHHVIPLSLRSSRWTSYLSLRYPKSNFSSSVVWFSDQLPERLGLVQSEDLLLLREEITRERSCTLPPWTLYWLSMHIELKG